MHYGSRYHSCSTKYLEMGNNTDAREKTYSILFFSDLFSIT